MLLPELEYGALLSYSPHGSSTQAQRSRNLMLLLKQDGSFQRPANPPILVSQRVAETVRQNRGMFTSFFRSDTILVPTPKSSLMQPGTLWVSQRLATALLQCGLGKQVAQMLERVRPVPKAALSKPENRPLPQQHYDSMQVQKLLSDPSNILLVDDIITRGATLLGAASRLAEAFPRAEIRAFAAMRAITTDNEFQQVYSPTTGKIILRQAQGDTLRRP